MAKKSTTKVTKKKSTAKPAAKKATAKKSSATKAAKKPAVKKAAASKTKTVVKKTTAKKKSILKPVEKKKEKKPIMAKRTKKVKEVVVEENSAAVKAKALSKIKGYSKKDLDHFKEVILEKRDEIIEQLQNLKDQMLDPTTGEYINENSPYSLHMAEQGTDAMEREKTFLYAQRENKFLGYLEDALKRIEAGTYGICIECIEEPQHLCDTCPLIPKARLEAVPHSQLCLPIKQRQEKSR
jgi:RNA polymerase-binding transcription factor DksA